MPWFVNPLTKTFKFVEQVSSKDDSQNLKQGDRESNKVNTSLTQVDEKISGIHFFELHMPTVSISAFWLFWTVLLYAIVNFLFRMFKAPKPLQPYGWPFAAQRPHLLNANLPLLGPQALYGYSPTPIYKRIEDAKRHIQNLEKDRRFLKIEHQEGV